MAAVDAIALDAVEDTPAPKTKHRPRDAQVAVTRRRLIEAGFATFGRAGYHATTMADVARAAGLSQGAAYNHFAGKEALFAAAYEAHNPFDALIDALTVSGREEAAVAEGFETRLLRALEEFGKPDDEAGEIGRDWFDLLLIDVLEFDCRHWRAMYRRQRAGFARIAGRLESSGRLRAIGGAAALRALIAAVLGERLVSRLLAAGEGRQVHIAAGTGILDVFLSGLLMPDSTEGTSPEIWRGV